VSGTKIVGIYHLQVKVKVRVQARSFVLAVCRYSNYIMEYGKDDLFNLNQRLL
jgi:hypothetical protein